MNSYVSTFNRYLPLIYAGLYVALIIWINTVIERLNNFGQPFWITLVILTPFVEEVSRLVLGRWSRYPILLGIAQILYEAGDLNSALSGLWVIHFVNSTLLQLTGGKKRILLLTLPLHAVTNLVPAVQYYYGTGFPYSEWFTEQSARDLRTCVYLFTVVITLLLLRAWQLKVNVIPSPLKTETTAPNTTTFFINDIGNLPVESRNNLNA